MAIAILPFVLAVVGALTYALSSNAKLSELGRLAYFAGLLALALSLAQHAIRIG